MCIICTGDYDINLTELNCSNCNDIVEIPKELVNLKQLRCYYTEITNIPKELVNLEYLSCFGNEINEIPKELVNLIYLDCGEAYIERLPKELINLRELNCESCRILIEIPKEFVNLTKFDCYDTKVKEIPKELINLTHLDCRYSQVKEIPKELVNLKDVKIPLDCIWDRSWIKTDNEINKINNFQIFWKKYGNYITKLPTLWKIAEYYTARKYSPENIMKYLDLE